MRRSADVISNLPDELLRSILTLMPLKSAIRTSSLSRRWKDLWKYRLTSEADLHFGAEFACSQSPAELVRTLHRYLRLHGDKKIDKFSILFCPFDLFLPDIESWMRTVVAKGVEELDLDLSQGVIDPETSSFLDGRPPFHLPDDLFHGSALTRLSLSRCHLTDHFAWNDLMILKTLRLEHVLINDAMIQRIPTSCPLLENLILRKCSSPETIKMASENLRLQSLALMDCDHDFVINVPNLRHFVFRGGGLALPGLESLPELVSACIRLSNIFHDEDGFVEFLASCSRANILTVCTVFLWHLLYEFDMYMGSEDTVDLNNLKELQILVDSVSKNHLISIFIFFGRCPCPLLESLFIQLSDGTDEFFLDANLMVEPLWELPDVTFGNLSMIKICNFRGSVGDLLLLTFFLERAPVLESVILVSPPQRDPARIAAESLSTRIIGGQLSILPKACAQAKVVLCEVCEDYSGINPTHKVS